MISYDFGKVSYGLTVKAALDESGVSPVELLRHHHFDLDDNGAAPSQPEGSGANWACTSFELPRIGRTVWVITDPQRQSTAFLLEEP